MPLAGPAAAARSGTAQLRQPPGGRSGTGRRGTDDQVPGGGRVLSGGAAAVLGALGRGQRLLHRCGTAGGRRWGGQQPPERDSTGTPLHLGIGCSGGAERRAGRTKPVRHQLRRRPTETQQARWEAVQQAREQGLSLRAIARNLGMAKNTAMKYATAESPLTKKLSAKERAKAEALASLMIAAN